MNFSSLVYKVVSGEWRNDLQFYKNLRQKRQSRHLEMMYAGAEPGLARQHAAQLSTPEDFKQAAERIVLLRAGRQMEEDFPFFDGILADFETYVVGDLDYMPGSGNEEADKVLKDYVDLCCATCDDSGRFDFAKIARLFVRSEERDGEIGAAFVAREQEGLKLQVIEGDRIGNPVLAPTADPRNFGGIIIDPTSGRPIIYQIYYRQPKMNYYTFQQDLPAGYFIHYYNPFRFSQYHGVTAFKNSIAHAYDINEIIKFTKLNIKWRSSQLPYVTNAQGKPNPGMAYEMLPNRMNGTIQPQAIQVDNVTQNYLKLEEAIVDFPNDFPNQQFRPVIDELRRESACGAKLPLEFCYRSEAGGVVQRFYVEKALETFQEHKRWLKFKFLNPTKNRMIQYGINTGLLDLRRFGNLAFDPARFKGMWRMGRRLSVDYGREVTADIQQIDAGLMSPQKYMLENNDDPREVRMQIKQHAINVILDAEEVAAKTGKTFEEVLPLIIKKFPNPVSAPPEKMEPQTKEDKELIQVD